VKEYFANYFLHMSDVTIDLSDNSVEVLQNSAEPWRVTLLDTGAETMTGGRLLRAKAHIGDEDFCFTYGDGLTDLDVAEVVAEHAAHDGLLTVTAVQPPGRYGALTLTPGEVLFEEKPQGAHGWVNGGFFVGSPGVLDYLEGDETVFERGPLERLSTDRRLRAHEHRGFWYGMDTLWDKIYLESLWESGNAPWKIWA
jgi:glucose-1-phosphate cytidylyltransferase